MNQVVYKIDGNSLDNNIIYQIANALDGKIKIEITEDSLKKMKASRDYVFKIVQKEKAVYGINTGFGALASTYISTDKLNQLQVNLIRSHCTGVGKPFSREITRAIMLLRANCLSSGYSGVNPDIVKLLLRFLEEGITPVVPEKGSVGASGDLAPLSHIALALIGEGEVLYKNKLVHSSFAIDQIGEKAIVLGPKDGLALINGTAVMAALGSIAVYKAEKLVKLADIACALTLEATRGTDKAYDLKISKLKPHPGQIAVSENLLKLLNDSQIRNSHKECKKVQDPYSLRCVPQVHGACRQTLRHTKEVLDIELNAVTDNPLIFVEEDQVLSGGNFHGEAVALAMDYLAMGLAEFCNISERRVEKLMNPQFSDLPAFLTKDSGLNSGLMIAHVTVAALVSENKYLCHPASIDSVPTSTDKEDHVSMGVTAGRKLHEVLDNLTHCLAIEFLCNTQGLDLLRPLKSTKPLEAVHQLIRKHVQPIDEDRAFYKDINNILTLIKTEEIINAVEKTIGPIH